MPSMRHRLANLPDAVHTVTVALVLTALYFMTAALLELSGLTRRPPLAPQPWLGLSPSLVNVGLALALVWGLGWIRPFVVVVPMVAYLLEYGFTVPDRFSLQAAELVALVLLMPVAVFYFLYRQENVRRWFSSNAVSET
jgi:hypothetical protein